MKKILLALLMSAVVGVALAQEDFYHLVNKVENQYKNKYSGAQLNSILNNLRTLVTSDTPDSEKIAKLKELGDLLDLYEAVEEHYKMELDGMALELALKKLQSASSGNESHNAKMAKLEAMLPSNHIYFTEKSAKQGNADEIYKLAYKYKDSKDYKNAFKWYNILANKGDARGYYELGFLYRDAHGVSCDDKKSKDVFIKAAEMGYAKAQQRVAESYYFGFGCFNKDSQKSLKWCRKAAKNGNAEAQYFLGEKLYSGFGAFPKDENEGLYWLKKAAAQGNKWAKDRITNIEMLNSIKRMYY